MSRRRIRGKRVTGADHHRALRRRAHRHVRKGELRKAVVALRQLAALGGEARHWVALGHVLSRANKHSEAIEAWKQGLWLHKQSGAERRAATVARLILKVDPSDRVAQKAA